MAAGAWSVVACLALLRAVRALRAFSAVESPILRILRRVAVSLHLDALKWLRLDFTVAYSCVGCMGLCWTLRSHRQGGAGGAGGPLRGILRGPSRSGPLLVGAERAPVAVVVAALDL